MIPANASVEGDRFATDPPVSAESSKARRASMPDQESASAATPQDLLQQMTLIDPNTGLVENGSDPKISTSDFSGNIISVTFCLPHVIYSHDTSGNWIIKARRGTSALFDSFSYLASTSTDWRHTLVGWTGEIESDHDTLGDERLESLKKEGAEVLPSDRPPVHLPHRTRHRPAHANVSPELNVSPAERRKLETRIEQLQGGRVQAVWLPDEVNMDETFTLRDQGKWRRYGEQELFTLFHYKMNDPADGHAIKHYWKDYVRMNETFADRVLEVYHPGDVILIHDYQLFLLPSILRHRFRNAFIGFFLHIPFPDVEYYRCLTKRKEILKGVLGANMIGFQTEDYKAYFAESCQRFLQYSADSSGIQTHAGHVATECFAIGIDTSNTWRSAFESERVEGKLAKLKIGNDGLKIIVGRDRLDSVRGVAKKLLAFEMFLDRHTQWHEKVKLVQVTSPTSIEDRGGKHDRTEGKIMELVNRINADHGSLGYKPVEYYASYVDKDDYWALLRMADVALITSVRDGMNTTALEYIVCQHVNRGPLIISEFSGTADSLTDAISINPWNTPMVAEQIDRALSMSDEEKTRSHDKLYQHVTENNVQVWTRKFVRNVKMSIQRSLVRANTPLLEEQDLLAAYHGSARRLFMFDYDGTLTSIVDDPDSAIPSARVIRALQTLASDKRNAVWIVSGRPQSFLATHMGHIQALGLSAEHGCFMRYPDTEDFTDLTKQMDMLWRDEVIDIFGKYTGGGTNSTLIERKLVAITWHYRNADPEWALAAVPECLQELRKNVEPYYEVDVMKGKMNLEVRPRFVNKGEIAKRLMREVRGEGPPDFVVAMGDDHTDEDMFRTLRASNLPRRDVFPVTVGPASKPTLASYYLPEPSEVIDTLEAITSSASAVGGSSTTTRTAAVRGGDGSSDSGSSSGTVAAAAEAGT